MKRRIFIAINLPENIKEELIKLLRILNKENRGKPIKWVDGEGLHITLHFLGSLNEEQISRVGECLEKVASQYPVSRLELDGLGGFPDLIQPRVIFVRGREINGAKIAGLQKELGKGLGGLGFEIERRPWQPHITLGRVKGDGVRPRVVDYNLRVNSFEVETVDLMESKLSRAGAQYSVIKSYKLIGV